MSNTSARCGCCAHRVHSISHNKSTETTHSTQSIAGTQGAPLARSTGCVG